MFERVFLSIVAYESSLSCFWGQNIFLVYVFAVFIARNVQSVSGKDYSVAFASVKINGAWRPFKSFVFSIGAV